MSFQDVPMRPGLSGAEYRRWDLRVSGKCLCGAITEAVMPEVITTRQLYPDSIIIGTPGKGGEIKVHFDSGNLSEAEQRIDNAVKARRYLLNKLAAGGQQV